MKIFSIPEALIYLNTIAPQIAPRSEETLRRAIRAGELRADVSKGRNGSRIKEEDLLQYLQKQKQGKSAVRMRLSDVKATSLFNTEIAFAPLPSLLDLVQSFGEKSKVRDIGYKVKLLETRSEWDERRSLIQNNIDILQEELVKCQSELALLDAEIQKN